MKKQSGREISRKEWAPNTPVDDACISSGSLQRIADSLEKIERSLFQLTPEGACERERILAQNKADEEFSLRATKICAFLEGLPRPDTLLSVARCAVASCVVDPTGDYTTREHWELVAKKARGSVRKFGNGRVQSLLEWIERAFPANKEKP
jgi:hypothetical protein